MGAPHFVARSLKRLIELTGLGHTGFAGADPGARVWPPTALDYDFYQAVFYDYLIGFNLAGI
jgi:hypothetical protein